MSATDKPARLGPKLAGAVRAGLVLGWWIAFVAGLLWSLS